MATPSGDERITKKDGWTNLRFPVLKLLLSNSEGGPAHNCLKQNLLGLDVTDLRGEWSLGHHLAGWTRRLDRPSDLPSCAR